MICGKTRVFPSDLQIYSFLVFLGCLGNIEKRRVGGESNYLREGLNTLSTIVMVDSVYRRFIVNDQIWQWPKTKNDRYIQISCDEC